MTKLSRSSNLCRAQRGDALLEALIGILLLAILGLGLSYSVARMLVSQRYAATHGIMVAQMRNALETGGLSNLCSAAPDTISIVPAGGSEISVQLPAAQCEKHDVTIVTITKSGAAFSVTLPQAAVTRMSFSTPDEGSARDLLGPGSIVLSQ
ncbi:hypothetical protein N5C12_06480 [Comamonas aquatica]|uniref:hypothetical protein n=1 Tax=Comamonas aquatica TaxID=225991 RepID=UPI00244CCE29|nr:hypothetical protein [Comamonas aquatica]MDH0898997.1 hypothetical protein [Comamonas aquatica]